MKLFKFFPLIVKNFVFVINLRWEWGFSQLLPWTKIEETFEFQSSKEKEELNKKKNVFVGILNFFLR